MTSLSTWSTLASAVCAGDTNTSFSTPRRSVGAINIWAVARYRGTSTRSAAIAPKIPRTTPATINQRPRQRKPKSRPSGAQSAGAREPASITPGRVKPFSTLPNLPRGIWNMTGCSLPTLNSWQRRPLRARSRFPPPGIVHRPIQLFISGRDCPSTLNPTSGNTQELMLTVGARNRAHSPQAYEPSGRPFPALADRVLVSSRNSA